MSKRFLTHLNLNGNELQNAVVQRLASAPSSPTAGQIYYNTVTNKIQTYNGTGWVDQIDGANIDTDITLAANSDTQLASQKAVKTYVDNLTQGLSWKQPVRAAATSNGTLASAFANGSTLDGVTLATGDRILLTAQSAATENGIYIVQASGAPTRASDANTGAELVNATVYVSQGTSSADTVWTCTTNSPITVGSTSLVFAQVNGGTVPTATTTVAGKAELATQSEAEARSDTTVALTPASVANFPVKKIFTLGDGSATQYDLTHNLGTKEVITQIRLASDDTVVDCDITNLSTTVVRLNFTVAPTTNAIKAVVMG